MVGYFYLWYELNVGQCTNITSRGRGHLPYGRPTWMLQVRQNKDIECNEMRNFLLDVIVVTRDKHNNEQTALMDYGNYLPHPTPRCFFCDINWNLTHSTNIKNVEIESEVF